MFGKNFSPEYLNMQIKDKKGENNPMFGKKKSQITIAKLQKLIYVYEAGTLNYIGAYSTVLCSKEFKMGKYTLTKYLKNGLPWPYGKKKIFPRKKL